MTDVRACVCLWRMGGLVGLLVAWPLTLRRGAMGRAAWGRSVIPEGTVQSQPVSRDTFSHSVPAPGKFACRWGASLEAEGGGG